MGMQDQDVISVQKCVAGGREAFGELYDRYINKIYRFVYYKVFDKEAVEDIVSDVFYKALERIGSYDASKGPFSAWLYRVARNTVIDYYRTKHEMVDIEDFFDVGVSDRTLERIDADIMLTKVGEYLKTLSPKQREIVTLRVWGEMSYREIAEIVGGSEDGAKMAFSRAVKDIREQCGPFALIILLLAGRP